MIKPSGLNHDRLNISNLSNVNPNIQILDQIISRDIENLYENIRTLILESVPPFVKPIAINYISANEPQWIYKLNEYRELIINASFPTPETTLEDGLNNANKLINGYINNFLLEKLGVPENTLQLLLPLLFGVNT